MGKHLGRSSPIVVNHWDTRYHFSFQANSPFPGWPQTTTIFDDKWDEVLVSGTFSARRSKFGCKCDRPFENLNPGLLSWFRVPVIHPYGTTEDNLVRIPQPWYRQSALWPYLRLQFVLG